MPPAEIERAIPASRRPQPHGLDGAAAGVGWNIKLIKRNWEFCHFIFELSV